jgi:hypothetical protein
VTVDRIEAVAGVLRDDDVAAAFIDPAVAVPLADWLAVCADGIAYCDSIDLPGTPVLGELVAVVEAIERVIA